MRRLLAPVLVLSAAAVVAALSSRLPAALADLEVFRVDRVEVEGLGFLSAAEVERRLALPPGASVWDDPSPREARIASHPLVARVDVGRRFPSTLVVRVEEREPVALVATPTLEPVDREGRRLPVDPARQRLDLPLLSRVQPGTGPIRALAAEVARLADEEPSFAALLSELAWREEGHVEAHWGDADVIVRYRPPLTGRRVREAMAVLDDVSARHPGRRVESVDLRFADQVVVRLGGGGRS